MAKLTLTQAQIAINNASELIRCGTMLAIDPSSGSKSSMPGYAFYRAGVCEEWGTIELDHRKPLKEKLYMLGDILRARWPRVDVLVTEQIAPFMSAAGTDFKNKAVVNLHKSIGALFASVYATATIEISPQSWHGWLRKKELHDTYDKSDANDALVMALYALENAGVPIDWKEYLS